MLAEGFLRVLSYKEEVECPRLKKPEALAYFKDPFSSASDSSALVLQTGSAEGNAPQR